MAAQQPSPSRSSIILVGQRGSGLSSFAVITAQLTGFEVVEIDALFVQEHASSRAAYLRAWGEQRYRQVAARFFQDTLLRYKSEHVLVCGSDSVDPATPSLLDECSPGAPVVMVNCDLNSVRNRLNLADSDQSMDIINASQMLCRRVSDLEFYNLPEEEGPESVSDMVFNALRPEQSQGYRTKRLRNVTQDVTRFLNLLGYLSSGNTLLPELNAFLSREFPSFTTLRVPDIVRDSSSLADSDFSSDALEISLPPSAGMDSRVDQTELTNVAFQLLRRHHPQPIIYHVQFEPDTALAQPKRYLELCRHGLRLLPEYATIDLQCSDQEIATIVAASHKCTRIVANRTFSPSEDFSWNDPFLFEQCRRAAALGCHQVRFVHQSSSPSEDRDCASFQILANAASSIAVSAICIDRYAKSSAVNSPGFVAVSKPGPASSPEDRLLPTSHELNQARFSNFTFYPLHFYVFGASVSYSMSPAMHNAAFKFHGLQHSYSARQSSSLEDLSAFFDDTFGGASISLPFKSDVMSLLDSVSESAKAIQAVNTILPIRETAKSGKWPPRGWKNNRVNNRAGKITGLHGENTDWIALRTCIGRQLSAANSVTPASTSLVVGAGGMARASVYALMSLGIKNIVIWNRTLSRAQQLVGHFEDFIRCQEAGISSIPNQQLSSRFHILESLTQPWPADMKQPSIIICTPPAHRIGIDPGLDFKIPQQWFRSATGGVIVEVSPSTSEH